MTELSDKKNIPNHIAVIMDGNGRWAKKKGNVRIFGHQNAVKAVRETTENSARLGVKFLTLYAFSTENWSRPQSEVNALMKLLVSTIRAETPTLSKNKIRLNAIGDIEALPKSCQRELAEAIEITKGNDGMVLTLALSYSGRWDIVQAMNKLVEDVKSGKLDKQELTEADLRNYMSTAQLPDPELMIRTSGEMRISNFLLWELAYAELFFTDVLWPDFRKEHLYEAIEVFQKRERRFGKISEQLQSDNK